MKFIKKIRLEDWFLLIILLLALFVRVYRVGQIMGFWYDQGRDALVIWDLTHKGKLFLIGPTTGIAGIFRGPWYYWLITPFYFLGRGNPVWPADFLALTTVAAIWFLYKLGKEVGGVWAGILAAFIASISYYIVSASRWLSNPTPMFLISAMLLWSIWQFFKKKFWSLPLIAFLAGMAIQFGSAAEIFYIPAILIILIWKRKLWPSRKIILASGAIFFMTFVPQIAFDIKHDGIFLAALKKFFFEDQSFKLSFWQMTKVRLPFYYNMLANNFWINGKNLFAPFFLIAMASLLIAWRRLWKINLFRVILLLAVTPFIGMLFFQGNQGNVYEYYFTGYYLIFILLVSVLLTVFHRKILGKLILVVFVLTFLKMNWPVTTNAIRTGTDGPAAIYLGNEKQIIDWVYEDAGNKTFNVDVYVPPVIPYAYDYLFKWYGGVVHGRSPEDKQVSLLYTIYEVDYPHPERLDAWLKRQAKIGKVEKEVRYGGIAVQRRTRLLYEKNN